MTKFDIALTLTPGLGLKGCVMLLDIFSSAETVFSASLSELIHFAQLREDVARAIVQRVALPLAEAELRYCERHSILPIASTDPHYPPLLRQTVDYPHVIYVRGNPEVLSLRSVSVIGTRRMSPYGDRICSALVHDIAEVIGNVSIVSGLAFGVDAAAHRAALHCDLPTVAVIANALPAVIPTQHTSLAEDIVDSGGAIVSECHSQTKQRGQLYISRNRIIAGMSAATVVVESPNSGGSMVTASIAAGYDRLVMAVPARLTDSNSSGCNALIGNRQAQLYYSAQQLARELMWDSPAPSDRVRVESLEVDLSEPQRALLSCFAEATDPLPLEQIAELSALDASSLNVMLTELELLGVLRMLPGNRYELLHVLRTVN